MQSHIVKLYTFRYGYVDFKTHEEAKKAVDRPVKIFGRSLNLDMASYKPDKTNGMNILLRHMIQCVDINVQML